MPTSVVFPKFNLEKSSGEISVWHVADGDAIAVGQLLFEIEDDKAAVEVESTEAGVIGDLVEEATEIDVGTVVANIYASAEEQAAAAASATPAAAPVAATPEPAAVVAAAPVSFAPSVASTDKVRSTPLARRIARENGLSLEGIAGTGPNGRIQRRDVNAQLSANVAAPVVSAPSATGGINTQWLNHGEGTPVVFIHGFSGELISWNPLLSGANLSWPALGVDLPCHGESDLAVPRDLDDVAAQIEAALLEQGVPEAILCGHSFGGAVAARIASRGQIRVRAQCLFAPGGLTPEISPIFVTGMSRARSAESLTPWLEMLVADKNLITHAFVSRTAAGRVSDAKFAAVGTFADRFFPDQTQRFNVLDDLAQAAGPVRVVYGRQDRVLPAEATRALPGNVALHLWGDCGHMPHFEYRKQALQVLQEVIRSC